MGTLIASLLLLGITSHAHGYATYQERIPNGNNVDHPCKANYRWPGLGHENPLGGGVRNPFGLDFQRMGATWSTQICQMDSDGDGRSNGAELGDPLCQWRQGNLPEISDGITHPGVCEPLDSPQCQGKNDFVNCELDKFEKCDTINQPQVRSSDLTFPLTVIPNTETNYFCMTFDLPIDQDYHLIGYEPLIENANVMHHILLYGCKDPNGTRIPQPELCGMSAVDNDCKDLIGLWAIGVAGVCYPPNLGHRFGRSGFHRVRMESHYHNPDLRSDFTDSSGLKLYWQPSTPQMTDLMTFWTGQRILEIPPGQPRIEHVGVCKGSCTSKLLLKPAYIISTFNHMHYLGRAMSIEIFRDGKLFEKVTDEEYYSYDSPIQHDQDPFLELRPGDEIRTNCVFNSMSSPYWTYWGEGTYDEMCFGFLTVFPKDAFAPGAGCVAFGPMDSCDLEEVTPIGECNWGQFITKDDPETKQWWSQVEKSCNTNGFCRPECREITNVVKNHPCMKGEAAAFVNMALSQFIGKPGSDLLARLSSCKDDQVCPKCEDNCQEEPYVADGASGTTAAIAITLASVLASRVFTL